MVTVSLELVVAYLLLGYLASSVLRKGRPEDWDESLLASIVALPMFLLLAVLVLARLARKHMLDSGSGPTAHA
jgi:membrane protein DedA with SNARE-associated domain